MRRIYLRLPGGEYGDLVRRRASNEMRADDEEFDDERVLAILKRAGKSLEALGEDTQNLREDIDHSRRYEF